MNPPKGTDYSGEGWFWKPVAIGLMSFLTAMTLMVMREHVLLRDFVTKAEAKEMIEHAPFPWIEDRKYVIETLSEIKKDVKEHSKLLRDHIHK